MIANAIARTAKQALALLAFGVVALPLLHTAPALALSEIRKLALSEIKKEEVPPPATAQQEGPSQPEMPAEPELPAEPPATEEAQPGMEIPAPDPIRPVLPSEEENVVPDDGSTPEEEAAPGEEIDPDATPDKGGQLARPDIHPDAPPPEIQYDVEKLPEPVKRMRSLLVEACKTGDIEKLRPLLGKGDQTQLSFGNVDGDPVTFLKGLSGDEEGVEILAIMEEVLNAGYVHLNAGKPDEIYVWPYFFGFPLDKLTGPQKVELFKIVTAGDFEEMKSYDAYLFYRLGIRPDGQWAFFIAGE